MILKEFKGFLQQRSLIDMASAIVLGNAFSAVITSLIKEVLTPLCVVLAGRPNLESFAIRLGDVLVLYGNFIQTCLNFLFISFVFFIIVRSAQPLGKALEKNVIDPFDEKIIDPVERQIRGAEKEKKKPIPPLPTKEAVQEQVQCELKK